MFEELKKLIGSETSIVFDKIIANTTTHNNSMVNMTLLVGSALMLSAMYIYTDRKSNEQRKEAEAQRKEAEARFEARLDAKDAQMLARLDAKDARFEAFVERVLASTRPLPPTNSLGEFE